MYLEPIQAFSQLPMQVRCKDGTFDTDRGIVPACKTRGGVATGTSPIRTPYDLVGTATNWTYPACKTGYTRKSSISKCLFAEKPLRSCYKAQR